MQEAKKSLVATAAVVAVIVVAMVGGLVRNRMEIGPGVDLTGSITMDSLVSSTNGVPNSAEGANDPINESTYFYKLMQLLEKEYVDDITDEQSLAVGAIRGMVGSLADSYSYFLKPEQMSALNDRMNGQFDGIGVELKTVFDETELKKLQNTTIGSSGTEADVNFDPMLLVPSVIVSAVAPGSNADKAGIRAGDRIMKVNGKWSISSEELKVLRDLRAKFDAKQISNEEFQKTAEEFRDKFESSITASRIADQLLLGKDGTVDLEWRSNDGTTKSAVIHRGSQPVDAVSLHGDTLILRFFKGSAEKLKQLDLPDNLTIDLRQGTMGDFKAMRECLRILVPDGNYGSIESEQAGAPKRLTVTDGAKKDRKISLLVGDSTWGAAAVFASALTANGQATIAEGTLPSDIPWIEVFNLPNGSGYTLRTGTFVAKEAR